MAAILDRRDGGAGGNPAHHRDRDRFLSIDHRTRDRLSHELFAVSERIASYAWDTTSVEPHLRALSASMAAEVDYLLAVEDAHSAAC